MFSILKGGCFCLNILEIPLYTVSIKTGQKGGGWLRMATFWLSFLSIYSGRKGGLAADGNSGHPFLTQTGQRSGELTANYD